ncbi:MAG TPA: hypothetical protein VM095_16005 [Pyrinomonadaceae bacterium]|nr:hypothetical protein [Pyrinomonadaceae bacterium]
MTEKEKPLTEDGGGDSSNEPTREEERGESSEADAPTSGVENAGMSTILDGDLGTGVQTDADDE